MSLLIRGAIVVNADAESRTDVLCVDGRIAALGERAVREAPAGTTTPPPAAAPTRNTRGKVTQRFAAM